MKSNNYVEGNKMKILMVAAENDSLPGGKVGGIGDVVRDMPIALAAAGQQIDVIMPGYGTLSQLPSAQHTHTLEVMFRGYPHSVDIYNIVLNKAQENVTLWVAEHPLFSAGGAGKIYCDDADNRPFATDATKFALFCASVAKAITSNVFGHIDVLHLHDWHTALISVLRAYDPQYQSLKSIHTVYTIHNLALQGIRPLADDESSLKAWFPNLQYNLQQINDPLYPHCYNPMRSGINLSDKVHAVSPNYTREILLPSNPEQGHYGGEGLQDDLRRAADNGRLHGILNGCEYPKTKSSAVPLEFLFSLFENELLKWVGNKPLVDSAHLLAIFRLAQLSAKNLNKNTVLVTSVGRITDQKVRLLQQKMPTGETALEQLLISLGEQGLFVLLGSGDAQLEQFLTKVAGNHQNFIFLKGYSETLSENIYSTGDLFLMPSSFEPCGISQMLAMRAGQACLAHCVGGLKDTIQHHENGFTFSGVNPENQAANMISCFQSALKMKQDNKKQWDSISANAAQSRFLWSDAAQGYIKLLYV